MMLLKQITKNRIYYQHHLIYIPIYFNHYQTLNVTPTATDEEIKQSFLKLAKQYHPDTVGNNNNNNESSNPSSESSSNTTTESNTYTNTNTTTKESLHTEEFIKIKEAYDILKEPNSRKLYDMEMFPDKVYKESEHFYFYRQAEFEENHFRRKHEQKRKINFALNSLILLSLTGFIASSVDIKSLFKPSSLHDIRRQNVILANEAIDDGPITQERRRQQYANEIKEKKIYGNVIELKVRGAAQETTKAREKRLKGIGSIDGVQKEKTIDLSVYQDQEEYM